MRTLLTLYQKELRGFFLNPFGWAVLILITVMQGVSLSTAMAALKDAPLPQNLIYITFHTPNFWFYFLFLFPLITMRLFSEEERSGTLETLLTAPVRTGQVVLGKFLAAYTFFVIAWIPAIVQFQFFKVLTDVPAPFSSGALIGAFAIVFLMGAFFTAIGCLASALCASQIVAGIITIDVTPPEAAARLADLIVSRCSPPGSPINTRASTRPGANTRPLQSIILQDFFNPSRGSDFPIFSILPLVTNRSPWISRF